MLRIVPHTECGTHYATHCFLSPTLTCVAGVQTVRATLPALGICRELLGLREILTHMLCCAFTSRGLCISQIPPSTTETKVESGTSQSKSATSANFSNSGNFPARCQARRRKLLEPSLDAFNLGSDVTSSINILSLHVEDVSLKIGTIQG